MIVKRGDTFAFYANMTDESGTPLDILTTNLKCQIRDPAYRLLCDMTITKTETPGKYLFEAPDTSNWPLGDVIYDIKIDNLGKITSTETETVQVIKEVTRNG